jgi:fluoroquinolone transport system permease protein
MTFHRKALFNAFAQYLVQIFKDAILILLCIAPILAGAFFKYGIPVIQELLAKYLNLPGLLTPYYLLFDLLLGSLTPVLYCFAAAYVILGEIDDGISKYFAVTPVGKNGYLVSRLGLPAVVAFFISIITLEIFMLSGLSLIEVIMISFASSLLGVLEALLVVSLSGNKVEGMAVSKLSGLFFLGLPAPFFLTGNIQYLLFFLPSFWVSKYAKENNFIFIIIGIVISFGWIMFLYRRFEKKIR